MRQWRNVQLNRPITMCIAQFNLYLVVAILPITRPAIASHNLARFNPRIKQTQPRNAGIGKTVRVCIPYAQSLSLTVDFCLFSCLFTKKWVWPEAASEATSWDTLVRIASLLFVNKCIIHKAIGVTLYFFVFYAY